MAVSFFNKLLIKFCSKFAGTDQFGNKYYEVNIFRNFNLKKRFVLYKGSSEASKIPPSWFLWIHYQTSKIPCNTELHSKNWKKSHIPNFTGTNNTRYP
ncbi:MAG: NADH-ubiquinone oxidoreductase subunit NDUFA12 family protein, partial [Proteobacteria bacterium]|nr:NADH-ubiquinone oxidoreductase subunit NDUFA12 family protein [Pseudomonadota bacterium]